jgi:outer membrane protein assembly factor BamE (lipoprotein component of BamABCDE complex)
MAMKKTSLLLILALGTILLSACHFIPDDELYNNTGSDIVITAYTLISNGT